MSSEVATVGRSLPAFIGVGALGFCADAGIMTALMVAADVGPLAARAASFPAALLITWLLNRRYTFRGRGMRSLPLEYLGYSAIQVTGALLNVGVFVICLYLLPSLKSVPVIPLGIGAGIALGFNYSLLRLLLYRRGRGRSESG